METEVHFSVERVLFDLEKNRNTKVEEKPRYFILLRLFYDYKLLVFFNDYKMY
jgi:hypothetical protein